MGVGDQFACASLVAAFSLALFITANLFVESRSSKSIVLIPAAQQTRIIPLWPDNHSRTAENHTCCI
jgi:hypothetical protein